MGSLVQTYLNEEERETFDLVQKFLIENDKLNKDTPYAMVKYCIKFTCAKILDRFSLEDEEGEEEIESDAPTEDEEEILPDPEPEQEGEKKKRVMKYVIGGIDFRPKA